MAFEQPIEADQVNDFNLLSAFVRAPLWVLGGVLGHSVGSGSGSFDNDDKDDNDNDDIDKDRTANPSRNHRDGQSGATGSRSCTPEDPNAASSKRNRADGESSDSASATTAPLSQPPSFASVDGAYAATTDKPISGTSTSSLGSKTSPQRSLLRRSNTALKRRSKLSWSDESGQNLVEYAKEGDYFGTATTRPVHSHSSTVKPFKSALKKPSTSGTGNLDSMDKPDDGSSGGALASSSATTRYIPRMNQANSGAIIMPRKPHSTTSAVATMENESPQWGFYTTFTPPTPEMYQGYGSNSLNQVQQHPQHYESIREQQFQYSQTDSVLSLPNDEPFRPNSHRDLRPRTDKESTSQSAIKYDGDTDGEENDHDSDLTTQDGQRRNHSRPQLAVRQHHNNKIFQAFQATKTAPMGWTSVPM